jgi:DNA-binding CsgD family transcriptional regulator
VTITAGVSQHLSVPVGPAVPSLVRWGLSADADLVFRTLVTFGVLSARDLAADLGLAPQRTADALAELLEHGAAVPVDGAAGRAQTWVARRPEHVVSQLRARRLRLVDPQAQARSHHDVVRMLRETMVGRALPVGVLPAGGSLGEGMRYLPTRELARDRLAEVVATERHEHLAMSTEQAWDAESARAAAPQDQHLVERGVQVRTIGVPPADGDQLDVSGHLVNGTSYRYRESPDVPMKLLLMDRRLAIFPADPTDLERGYFETSQPTVVRALVALFDRHWALSVDGGFGGVPPIVLSDRERTLIHLLAAGHTDHSAAEYLRLSTRSVTYTLRSVMDRLGVENRFQLGLTLGALRVAAPPSLIAAAQES